MPRHQWKPSTPRRLAWLGAGVLAACSPAGLAHAQADAVPPAAAPLDLAEVGRRIDGLVGFFGPRVARETIGVSREGRPIHLVRLGHADRSVKRPAILLVGGMDGEQLASTDCVLESLLGIARENPAILDEVHILAIPIANPDTRAAALAAKHPRRTNARVVDDDRDGVADEDAPRDINGDALVTMMRRIAPPGRVATHVVDAADPRIVRPANRDKGEVATHEVFVEGADRDGDGVHGEDAAGGVDLDRNFTHRWPEFSPDAGPYQLSEPETLAIAKFVRDHPEIVTAVVFGRHDTLVNFPDTKDMDATGRTPMVYHRDDHGIYRDFAKMWKDATKIERSANADLAGSLVLWLANHRGIAAVAANGWARPEPPALPEGTPAPAETGDAEQAAWLAVSDRMRDGAGFVPWKAFDHPELGAVEIGGFAPFFRESPTPADGAELAKKSAAFVAALAARRPKIEVSEAVVTPLADGLARVEVRVTNAGNLATTTEMGRITGSVPPVVVRLSLPPDAVFSGRPVEKIERLAAGASEEFAWTIRLDAGASVDVSVTGPFLDPILRTAKTPGAARASEGAAQ
ncbi:MAG: hypothetical protein GC172_01130 [Phycisphaera sp.]|nr:hypothetical protein [Phycisphaera sp.]